MSKSEDRLALEARATAAGVSFAPNIGDDKLADRVAKAEAAKTNTKSGEDTQGVEEAAVTAQNPDEEPADQNKPQATGGGGTGTAPAEVGDVIAAPAPDPDEDQSGSDEDVPVITVICHHPDGRRRSETRWPAGVSTVPVGDLTPFQLAQLEADPLFTVKRPAGQEG
ncbi:MAG: hypothetical protein CML68_20325 [Rhodobacteraceae bacterium]|nr:hypothetical protein [Paracoccaceae bacterium]